MNSKDAGTKIGFLKSLAFALIPLITIAFMLEAGLRFSGIWIEDDGIWWGKIVHPQLGWDLKPNFSGKNFDWVTDKPGEKAPQYRRTIKINSAGFRDDNELTIEKPDNTVRIFTLGDSCTFGWGVESEDSFAKVLEKKLNDSSSDINYQVLNAGIVGYSSHQGMPLLKHKILKYSPDIITVAYGWNSHFIFPYSDKEWIKPVSPLHAGAINIARQFMIYRGFTEIVKRLNKKSKSELKYRVPPEDLRNNLRSLIDFASESNIKVVLMTIQSNVLTGQVAKWTLVKHTLDDDKENMISRHKEINGIIKEVSEEKGTMFTDVAGKFVELKLTEGKELFYRPEDAVDDVHPNEEGHLVIGEELFKTLSREYDIAMRN